MLEQFKSKNDQDSEPAEGTEHEKRETAADVSTTEKKATTGRALVSLFCRLLSDVMLVGIIISTVLGVVHNAGQEVIRATAKPLPFFPRIPSHRVKDYYKGNIFQAFSDVADYENALFMYYAPWDRACMEARAQLVEVARFFSNTDVAIVAVNCWYPTSECAKEFGNKSLSSTFPVFIFYPGILKGVQFRGHARADHLIRWVQHCRYPLYHLNSSSHLSLLQSLHPSLLLGYLPQTTSYSLDQGHVPLLATSLSLLEIHPDRSIGVAVTMDPSLARTLRLGVSQSVRLLTWNSSTAYPNKTLDSDRLLVWTLQHDSQAAPWLRLPGRKSMVLQRSIGQHSLLVFTDKPTSDYRLVSNARRVAASYRDCVTSPQVTSYRTSLSKGGPWNSPYCGRYLGENKCMHSRPHQSLSSCKVIASNRSCDDRGLAWERSQAYDEDVGFLLEEDLRERSQQNTQADWEGDHLETKVQGLGCGTNKTLNIMLVDRQKHTSLLSSLGLIPDWEGAVILSPWEESIIQGKRGVEEKHLEDLISSWHADRVLTTPGMRSTHPAREGFVRMGSDTPSSKTPTSCDPHLGDSCLVEIDTESLQTQVLNSSTPGAVLLYTSSFCTYCTAVSHVLHTVQSLLKPLDSLGLRFYIIDATRNDLPVQFTALSYPTVLIFPEHRKTESRVFPVSKELNTTNLLSFIVSNLSPSTRLRLALSSCDTSCQARLRLSASSTLSRLIALGRRRPEVARRRSYIRRVKYNKTVLYVAMAWSESNNTVPRVSESFVAAILESFKEASIR